MNCERLHTAACGVVLGVMPPEELPSIATAALVDGCDSRSLRILAGLEPPEYDEARALFDDVLAESSLPWPTGREAALCLARETAARILSGSIGPYEGALHIWDVSLCVSEEHLPQVDTFIYAASEWPDRPDAHDLFADGVRTAAR